MAIFLNENSKVIVQGMTGSEGTQAHPAHARLGHRRRRRRQPAQGRPERRLRRHRVPVFGSRRRGDGGDRRRRQRRLRAADVRQGRRHRGHRRRASALAVVITEGIPVHDTTVLLGARARAAPTRIIGPNCPGLISPGRSNAGIIPADITKAGQDRPGQQVRHADLPDDVRAAGHRLLHRASASAATRSSAPRTSTACRPSRTTRRPRRS